MKDYGTVTANRRLSTETTPVSVNEPLRAGLLFETSLHFHETFATQVRGHPT